MTVAPASGLGLPAPGNSIPLRALTLIPAHNEAGNLPAVIDEIREQCRDLDILVVDDGSTDGTTRVLDQLGVRRLGWPLRRGVGCAVRAGLRYGARLGFEVVVRLDADGQHDAADIERLLTRLAQDDVDAVLGSRYVETYPGPKVLKRTLAAVVSAVTRRRITDATSGFWALGPRAVALLAEHHPRGYPEPELHLFLSRNGLRVAEVPVCSRARLSGRSSLTLVRLLAAGARVLLAVIIVPLRQRVAP
jgi:glycosyltransferase involved in cell wall biosynthesis